MDYVTIENVKKSFKSQLEAITEMYKLFPKQYFELNCSSSNGRNFEGFRIRCSKEEFVPIATDFYFSFESLFDMGKPKIIQESYWVYGSSFSKLRLSWRKSYSFYRTEYAMQRTDDETGMPIRIPPKENSFDLNLTLELDNDYSIGLKNWAKEYPKLKKLLNKNPNKEMVKKFQEQVDDANQHFLRWKEEIKKITLIKV